MHTLEAFEQLTVNAIAKDNQDTANKHRGTANTSLHHTNSTKNVHLLILIKSKIKVTKSQPVM